MIKIQIKLYFYKIFLFLLILLAFSLSLSADSAELSISSYVDKTELSLNSTIKLTVEVTANKDIDVEPFLPELNALKLIGRSTSSSTSIRITNGRSFRTIEKDYIYTLSPTKTGKIIIPAITVEYEGKTYKTDTITLTVKKGAITRQHQSNNDRNNYQKSQISANDKIFLKATTTENEVYVGEPFTVQYKIYSKENLTGLQAEKMPEFSNFLKKEIYQADNINSSFETLNGRRFYTYKISEYTLFATNPGSFKLDEMRLICSYNVPSKSFFDFGTTERKQLISNPLNLNVKPLPESNKPADFSGAVGTFIIDSNINNSQVKVGESITYTLTISGRGNLDMFDLPSIPNLSNIEIFEPDIETKFSDSRKTSGQRIIKYVLIPQEPGEFEIPEIKFTFYNTDSEGYKTISAQKQKFDVLKSDRDYSSVKFTTPQGIEVEGSDISFIKDEDRISDYKLFYKYWWFWLIVFLGILIVLFSILYRSEHDKRLQDRGYYRYRISNKELKNNMKEVKNIVNNKELTKFFPAAEATIKNYIANKCNISASASTLNDISSELDKYDVDDKLKKHVKNFFLYSDSFRFGGSELNQDVIKEKYIEFRELISQLQSIDFRR